MREGGGGGGDFNQRTISFMYTYVGFIIFRFDYNPLHQNVCVWGWGELAPYPNVRVIIAVV